jgi:hypothetical protein
VHERFRQFARRSSEFVGSAEVFLVACVAMSSGLRLDPDTITPTPGNS